MSRACPPWKKKQIKGRLDRAKERMSAYLEAEQAVLAGSQEYRIGLRTLRRPDLQFIQGEIKRLENQVIELEDALKNCGGSRKTSRVLYRDL